MNKSVKKDPHLHEERILRTRVCSAPVELGNCYSPFAQLDDARPDLLVTPRPTRMRLEDLLTEDSILVVVEESIGVRDS